MVNRQTPPKSSNISNIKQHPFTIEHLDNGIPVILFSSGNQEVSKIDFIFQAGVWSEDKPQQAAATALMMRNGTTSKTSQQIANEVDFLGAYLSSGCYYNNAEISVFTLNKHLDKMLDIAEDVIKNPAFTKEEWSVFRKNKIQKLEYHKQRVDYLAKELFNQSLFGKKHPYGKMARKTHYNRLSTNDLHQFHQQYYHAGNMYILASGKLPDDLLKSLNRYFGGLNWKKDLQPEKQYERKTQLPGRYMLKKEGAVQSAIMIGKPLFTVNHPDYQDLKIANTVFGGYFGSRLMKNIREEKGYTYDIHSSVSSFVNEGCFYIAAETAKEVTQKAIDEIYKELDTLRTTLISDEELMLVRNYLLGNVLKMVDGPFGSADYFKWLYEKGLDEKYFYHLLDRIKNIDKETIRDLAKKYLDPKKFIEVVVS